MDPIHTGISTIHTPRLKLTGIAEQSDHERIKKWGISLRDQPEPVGECGFYEVGSELFVSIDSEHRNNGIATEAVSGVLAYGFLGLGIIEYKAAVEHKNYPSKKVMTNCGAKYAGSETREVGSMMVGEVPIYQLGYTAFKNCQGKLLNLISWGQ